MKGMVFTEFMDMVESRWGLDMIDDLIEAVSPPSQGAYTSVATYDFQELVDLVSELHRKTEIPLEQLLYELGRYLGNTFARKFPAYFHEAKTHRQFIMNVDQHIHEEVLKLFPDAQLPRFTHEEKPDSTLVLRYDSERSLQDVAHGLIDATSVIFKEAITIKRHQETSEGRPITVFQLNWPNTAESNHDQ